MNPRDVLSKIRWEEGARALEEVEVWYLHRGAPDDTVVVQGKQILEIGRSYLVLGPESTSIPYHRVLRIVRRGDIVWKRAPAPPGPETA